MERLRISMFRFQLIFQFQICCMSDPPLSDNDIKDKMAWVWTTLKSHTIWAILIYELSLINKIKLLLF